MKTWFLLDDGSIDEIDMVVPGTYAANQLAMQLHASYFWMIEYPCRERQEYIWNIYRTTWKAAWKSDWKLHPVKQIRSPDMAPVEMYCRTKAAAT